MNKDRFTWWCRESGGSLHHNKCRFDNGTVEFDGEQITVDERLGHQHMDRRWEGYGVEYSSHFEMIRAEGGEERERDEWTEFGVEAENGELEVGYL